MTSTESLLASTSANAITTHSDERHEKPPAKIEEERRHEYDEPPAFEEEAATQKATIQDKPVVILTPQSTTIIPETDTKYTNTSSSPTLPSNTTINNNNNNNTQTSPLWTILVRLSNSAKDIAVGIPTSAPFMTVSDLKQKIIIDHDQQIKLIHLGRILQDDFTLVPSTTTVTNKSDTIKVSNRGVIQAMIYKL